MGTLIDERVDQRDVSAVIIDLAVRGYLTIEEIDASSWFLHGRDYRFHRKKPPDGLKPFEKKLHAKLFDGKDRVLMSELATKFYPVIGEVKDDLYKGLSQDGYFDGNPNTVRGTFLGLGLLALGLAIALLALVQFWMIGRVFILPLVIARRAVGNRRRGHQPGHAAQDSKGPDRLGANHRAGGVHPPRRGRGHPGAGSPRGL